MTLLHTHKGRGCKSTSLFSYLARSIHGCKGLGCFVCKKGLIAIGKEKKRIDWNAIRAEYIGGGISQRKLAAKYSVSETTLMKRANAERWALLRKQTDSKITAKAQQKAVDSAADNAALAASIKRKLLQKINRIVEALPEEDDATEIREGSPMIRQKIIKLKDLTSMYKNLTADMQTGQQGNNELLQSLYDLEREQKS